MNRQSKSVSAAAVTASDRQPGRKKKSAASRPAARSAQTTGNAGGKRTQMPADKPAYGCWINIFEPAVGELVGACGYQYGLVDMEHSPATLDSALPMIRAVQYGGAKAIVRIPDKQVHWIGRLMDMGADGVMVPMVDSAEEAQALADATLYAPEGTRGMAAGIVRATRYGVDTEQYLESYRKDFMLMIQIESREAMEQAEAIAAVPGVDWVFIGPSDLAGSLGHRAQTQHKDTRAAVRQICKSVRKVGKPLSTLPHTGRTARQLFADGFDLVFSGTDMGMLRMALQQDAAASEKIVQGLVGKR